MAQRGEADAAAARVERDEAVAAVAALGAAAGAATAAANGGGPFAVAGAEARSPKALLPLPLSGPGEGVLVRGSEGPGGATPELSGLGRPGLQGLGRLQRIVELEVKIASLTAYDDAGG